MFLATKYCEIIVNKEESNKLDSNIWESVISLVKATSQELDKADNDCRQYLKNEITVYKEFAENPHELFFLFFPVIVFEGNMYEAKFSGDEVSIDRKDHMRLFIDYNSGRYKGEFFIDILNKENLQII